MKLCLRRSVHRSEFLSSLWEPAFHFECHCEEQGYTSDRKNDCATKRSHIMKAFPNCEITSSRLLHKSTTLFLAMTCEVMIRITGRTSE